MFRSSFDFFSWYQPIASRPASVVSALKKIREKRRRAVSIRALAAPASLSIRVSSPTISAPMKCAEPHMLSCANPEDGMGQFVVRHLLQLLCLLRHDLLRLIAAFIQAATITEGKAWACGFAERVSIATHNKVTNRDTLQHLPRLGTVANGGPPFVTRPVSTPSNRRPIA
jgi:hypothetical protein